MLLSNYVASSLPTRFCPLFSAKENISNSLSEWLELTVLTSCCFPAVMEYQLQINSVETKLQETRARKKQQEELIMKVENQALKVSNEHTLMLIFFSLSLF